MRHFCAYCGRQNADDPFVDDFGIGWLPACGNDHCRVLASRDAERQRLEKFKNSTRSQQKSVSS